MKMVAEVSLPALSLRKAECLARTVVDLTPRVQHCCDAALGAMLSRVTSHGDGNLHAHSSQSCEQESLGSS